MTHLIVEGSFDMDQLAAQFPGQLRFTGAPSTSPNSTEIQGDVDEATLSSTLHSLTPGLTIRSAPTPDLPIPPPNPYVTYSTLTAALTTTLTTTLFISIACSTILSVLLILILHWIWGV